MWRAAGGLGDCFSFGQERLPILDQLERNREATSELEDSHSEEG